MSLKDLLEVVREGTEEAALARTIDFDHLPRHVAVIMDGNGRWAGQRHQPRAAGHRAGINAVRETVETAARLDLDALTVYAFSTENWKRPMAEIQTLMALLKRYLRAELQTLLDNNIRFRVIGQTDELPVDVRRELDRGMERTASQSGLLFNIALNYSGRSEIVEAARALVRDGVSPDDIDEESIAARLFTAGTPDPDLLIRTGGEMRVSNFLLWQIAYAEIWVTDVLWPDFGRLHFLQAVADFQKRERRYGGIPVGVAVK